MERSPDFVGVPKEQALADFRARIEKYEKVYRTIGDDNLSYIKVMNLSSKIVCNKIHGRSQHRIVAFLMSLHVVERPVWLVRAGPVETDAKCWNGSWHPGVVAHHLKSPSQQFRNDTIASPSGGSQKPKFFPEPPSVNLGDAAVQKASPIMGSMPQSPVAHPQSPLPSVPIAASFDDPSILHVSSDGAFDEDDYWSGFQGTATWQRINSADASQVPPPPPFLFLSLPTGEKYRLETSSCPRCGEARRGVMRTGITSTDWRLFAGPLLMGRLARSCSAKP